MSRPPAFMFYAADFKTNTAELSHEERGVYIDLLCHSWINDGLPVEEVRLHRLIGGENAAELWDAISHLWERTSVEHPFGERWVNARQETERKKQKDRREQASKAGKASAESRKQAKSEHELNGGSMNVAPPVDDPLQPGADTSVSFSGSGSNTDSSSVAPDARARADALDVVLEELRALWPTNRSFASDHNAQREALFKAARQNGGVLDLGELSTAARTYLSAHGFTDHRFQGCPNLSTWLSDRRWEAPLPQGNVDKSDARAAELLREAGAV